MNNKNFSANNIFLTDKKEELIEKNSNNLLTDNYILISEIGNGSFGKIYLSYSIRDNLELAIKKIIKNDQKKYQIPQLENEAKIYQTLLNISNKTNLSGIEIIKQKEIQGISKFYGYGETINYYYLILEFLGPNLIELLKYCNIKTFTIPTVCLLSLQIINRIETLHKFGFLHRDIKPENFLLGTEDKSNIVYLIDFGLSKKYKMKNNQHIPYREGRNLIGTARYSSINTHLGIEQSRRDDLESIGYLLIFFLKGKLPWMGLKNNNNNNEKNKYAKIMEKKLSIPTEILCYGIPEEFSMYLSYCKNLKFEDKPDYDYCRNLFIKCLGKFSMIHNIDKELLKFDWCYENINEIWEKYNVKYSISICNSNTNLKSNLSKNYEDEIDIKNDNNKNNAINNQECKKIDNKNKNNNFLKTPNNNFDVSSSPDFNKNKNLNENAKVNIFENKKSNENEKKENNSSNKNNTSSSNKKENINQKSEKNSKSGSSWESSKLVNSRTSESSSSDTIKLNGNIKEHFEDIFINNDLNNDNNYLHNTNDEYIDKYIEKLMKNSKLEKDKYNEINKITNHNSRQNSIKKLKKNGTINNQIEQKTFLNKRLQSNNVEEKGNINLINNNIRQAKKFTTQKFFNNKYLKFFNEKINSDEDIQLQLKNSLNKYTILPNSNYLKKGIFELNKTDTFLPDMTNLYLKKDNIIKIKKEIVTESYVILQTLGKGSYGSVKKVRHKHLGDIRAMKIVNKVRNTLSKEIEILRKISHPNIINIYEIFEDRKKYYIITEFCEGGELFEQITKKGFYNELEAAKIIKQILQAVNYLHQLNIVHRDIKPENIMLLSHNLDLKLIDFGTALEVPKGKRLKKFIGTSYYIAPEVIMEDYDNKCDIWSCGIILYILLSGFPPFNGHSNKQIYNNIRFQKLYFSQDEWKGISKDAIELIKNMLNKNPENRFSAEDCLNHKWFNILTDNNKNLSCSTENKIQIIERMTKFVQENKFKQAVLQFITTQFNLKKEENYLRNMFREFDKDDKGVISKKDFQEQIKSLYGDVISEEITNKIFKNIDLDNSGEISYNEFLTSVIDDKKILTEDRLQKAFNMFDNDGNGMLSIEEIKGLFGGDEETWEHILKEVDMNGDKNVDFDEFKILMLGINPKDLGADENIERETLNLIDY